jgi:hypothetical protein
MIKGLKTELDESLSNIVAVGLSKNPNLETGKTYDFTIQQVTLLPQCFVKFRGFLGTDSRGPEEFDYEIGRHYFFKPHKLDEIAARLPITVQFTATDNPKPLW